MIDLITRRGQYEKKSATARRHGYIEDAKLIAARAAGLGEAIEVLQAYTEKPLPNDEASEPPTRDVNRDSGTGCANGGSLR